MFETSKDILFLVLSISVAFFTIFLCILLYHTIKILRQVNKTVDDVKQKFDHLHETIQHGFSYFGIISTVAKSAMEHFLDKKTKTKKKK